MCLQDGHAKSLPGRVPDSVARNDGQSENGVRKEATVGGPGSLIWRLSVVSLITDNA